MIGTKKIDFKTRFFITLNLIVKLNYLCKFNIKLRYIIFISISILDPFLLDYIPFRM
jgi:hypothetical protein